MKRHAGFTLIELMLVVMILAILMAITIPNLLRSRIVANQSAAVEDLSIIGTAQVTYFSAHNTYGSFESLTTAAATPESQFLDQSWVEGRSKSGYVFSMPQTSTSDFVCFADPMDPGVTGDLYYRIDSSGIVRFSKTGRPTPEDTAVGS